MNWQHKSFDQLTTQELYDILQLRSEIFVVEQDCVYQDIDGLDQQSLHLFGYQEGVLVAYVRILPPGLAYPSVAIGRVVVKMTAREKGLGFAIMEHAHSLIAEKFPEEKSISIMAQSYLLNWYGKLGYVSEGPEFMEDGIPHHKMVRMTL